MILKSIRAAIAAGLNMAQAAIHGLTPENLLVVLMRVIDAKRTVTIHYAKPGEETQERVVTPVGWRISDAGDISVRAMDDDTEKSFRIDRIAAYTFGA